jgi:hypothetical protein
VPSARADYERLWMNEFHATPCASHDRLKVAKATPHAFLAGTSRYGAIAERLLDVRIPHGRESKGLTTPRNRQRRPYRPGPVRGV